MSKLIVKNEIDPYASHMLSSFFYFVVPAVLSDLYFPPEMAVIAVYWIAL